MFFLSINVSIHSVLVNGKLSIKNHYNHAPEMEHKLIDQHWMKRCPSLELCQLVRFDFLIHSVYLRLSYDSIKLIIVIVNRNFNYECRSRVLKLARILTLQFSLSTYEFKFQTLCYWLYKKYHWIVSQQHTVVTAATIFSYKKNSYSIFLQNILKTLI